MSEFNHNIDPLEFRVNKFGGSSMAHPEVVADIIGQTNGINILSAPGKRREADGTLRGAESILMPLVWPMISATTSGCAMLEPPNLLTRNSKGSIL